MKPAVVGQSTSALSLAVQCDDVTYKKHTHTHILDVSCHTTHETCWKKQNEREKRHEMADKKNPPKRYKCHGFTRKRRGKEKKKNETKWQTKNTKASTNILSLSVAHSTQRETVVVKRRILCGESKQKKNPRNKKQTQSISIVLLPFALPRSQRAARGSCRRPSRAWTARPRRR